MNYLDDLATLTIPEVPTGTGRMAFLGCGDSLSAAIPARSQGHAAISAGDVAWSDGGLARIDTVVALSWSGRTAATVRAAERALAQGLPLLSITAGAASPLAALSEHSILLPAFTADAPLPAVGYALHAAAVAALTTGQRVRFDRVARAVAAAAPLLEALSSASGDLPTGITVASTPDTRGPADFFSLKLIEATGLGARVVPIEETGHVDYFIGPQPHLSLVLSDGTAGESRSDDLGAALARNGHTVVRVRARELTAETDLTATERDIVLGLACAHLASRWGERWNRPPFRGGAVDMSAQHIQIRA